MTTLDTALATLNVHPDRHKLSTALDLFAGISEAKVTVVGTTVTSTVTGNSVDVTDDTGRAGAPGELAWTIVFDDTGHVDGHDSYVGADALVSALHNWAMMQQIDEPEGTVLDRVRGQLYEKRPDDYPTLTPQKKARTEGEAL